MGKQANTAQYIALNVKGRVRIERFRQGSQEATIAIHESIGNVRFAEKITFIKLEVRIRQFPSSPKGTTCGRSKQ